MFSLWLKKTKCINNFVFFTMKYTMNFELGGIADAQVKRVDRE